MAGEGMATTWGGAQSITASPWGLGETPILITARWRCFTASWQARGVDGGIESVCCPYPQEAFLIGMAMGVSPSPGAPGHEGGTGDGLGTGTAHPWSTLRGAPAF